MDKIVVGDPGCRFMLLISVMRRSTVFHQFCENWSDLASSLEIDETVKLNIRRSILLDNSFTTVDILERILGDWRLREGTRATLSRFVDALKKNGFNDIITEIETWFTNEYGKETAEESINAESQQNERAEMLTDHLQYYIVDLVEATDLSNELLKRFEKASVLTPEELFLLESMFMPEDRNRRFYKIIKKKIKISSNSDSVYDAMFKVFSEDETNLRNGVGLLLNRAYE